MSGSEAHAQKRHGGFELNQTFYLTDANDRLWSGADLRRLAAGARNDFS
jgi:hypothetical protein